MIEKNQKILVACVIKELEKFELNIFIVNLIEMSKLICALCSKKLQEPKLCPHCSQIFCKECINNYLSEKHFCPTCDNYIIDLVDCARLVE